MKQKDKTRGTYLGAIFLLIGILFVIGTYVLAEEVTITTYYPAPYGVYSIMRLEPRSEPPSPQNGDIYVNITNNHIYCYLNGWKQLDP